MSLNCVNLGVPLHALVEPFAELAAGSVGLVGEGLDWDSEFTGAAGELVDAVRDMGSGSSFTNVWRSAQGVADQVSEADILELYRNRPAEVSSRAVEDYRQAREAADRQRGARLRDDGRRGLARLDHRERAGIIGLNASDNAPRVAPYSYPHPAAAISVHSDPAWRSHRVGRSGARGSGTGIRHASSTPPRAGTCDLLGDLTTHLDLRSAKLPGLLQTQPELRRRPKVPGQPQRGIGAHAPFVLRRYSPDS